MQKKEVTDNFVGTPLPNWRHEAFARGLAQGNLPITCYIGIGKPRDYTAAEALADQPEMRRRAEEVYRQIFPQKYAEHGYVHITDQMKQWKKEGKMADNANA